MCAATPVPNFTFGSDNTAGICPEAWAGLTEANAGCVASYGDDPFTLRAKEMIRALFEADCSVYFVFNGTAANSLALAACGRGPYTRVLCHEYSHVDTDECGAPEFFSGGAKLTAIPGPHGKLRPADVEARLHLGHGGHYPKPAALSLTQSTEWGTVYTPAELRALTSLARANGLAVHLDGARFANALAATGLAPAELSWRAGVDVLSFGGTKNGMQTAEAVVIFDRALAQDFEYRVKQGGQLSSKMRFVGGQWIAMLRDGAWLRHAAHANAMTQRLAAAVLRLPRLRILVEPEVNALFVEMPPTIYAALSERGWQFYRFIGEHGYRLMCSWATTEADVDAFVADLNSVAA